MGKNTFGNTIGQKILYFVIALPGFFLLLNNYPYLAVSSMLIVLLIGIFFLFFKRAFSRDHLDVLKILSFLYAYFVFSYFISGQPINNFFSYNFLKNDGNFFFCYILFFALCVPYFNYKKVALYYFNILFITFSLGALIGLFGYFSQKIPILFKQWGESYYKGAFSFLNFAHNATGSVFAMVCIFLLVFSLMEQKRKYRILYISLLLISLSGLLLTRSRGSYISFSVGALIVLWLYFKSIKKFFLTVLAMIVVSVPLVFLTGAYKRILLIFQFSENNNTWRFVLWERAFYLFKKSPIFGIGFGRFNDINFHGYNIDLSFEKLHFFSGYPGIISFYTEPNYIFNTAHAHNSYLQFLSETGIVGLGVLLLFWIICFKKIFKGYVQTEDIITKKIFLANIGAIVTLFVLAFTENYFSATTVMMCVSMVTSLSLGIYWQERNK